MLDKQFNFCGVSVRVKSEYDLTMQESLKKFEETPGAEDCVLSVSFESEILDTGNLKDNCYYLYNVKSAGGKETPYACVEHFENKCDLTALEMYREGFDVATALRNARLPHILLNNGAIILHTSYVLCDGEAILFCAPSGTGKTTQAELWKKYRGARIINGDRAIVRYADNGFVAGGIYYSGTSDYCENIIAPLKAIVLLSQAERNTAEVCSGAEALRRIFRECSYTAEFEKDPARIAQLVADIVNKVKIIRLDCLPNESAVTTLEEMLNGSTIC